MSLLILNACQNPPPTKPFQIQAMNTVGDKSLVPQDVFVSEGMTDKIAEQKAAFESQVQILRNQGNGFHTLQSQLPGRFHTLDYPVGTGCYNGCVYSMSVIMGWPAPGGYSGSSTISVGDPDLFEVPNINGYSYGISPVELGTNAKGQTIATKVSVGFAVNAWHRHPGGIFGRAIYNFSGVTFTSTDGIHYTVLDSSAGGVEFGDGKENAEDPGCGLGYYFSGSLPVTGASLVLDPASDSAALSVSYVGDVAGSQWDYRDWDPSNPPDTKSCRQVGLSGSASVGVSMNVAVNFLRTADIAIDATPPVLYDASSQSVVKVTPTDLTEPWEVTVTSPNENCPQPKFGGSGMMNKTFPSNASTLANGAYVLHAHYTNPLLGASSSAVISTQLPFSVTADKSEFQPVDTITYTVKAPPCPDWNLQLTAKGSVTGNLYYQVIPGSGNQSVSVSVKFPGQPDTDPSESVSAVLSDGKQTASGPTSTRSTTTTSPTPTPVCPIGVICGGGGGSPNPNPSSPQGGSPSPSPTDSPQVTPMPPPPPNSPSPTVSPPHSPTPTPNGGGGDCTEPGHRMVKVAGQKDQICVYCPAEYFEYNEDPHVGCYTILNFKIEPTPSPDPAAPPVFSPRDVNGVFDELTFMTSSEQLASRYVKWDMQVKAETGPLVGDSQFDGGPDLKNQIGLTSVFFDGWVTNQSCLIDGKYKVKLVPKSEQPSGIPDVYRIKVPDYQEPVDARVIVNPYFVNGQLQEKKELDFWVDNTPSLAGMVSIQEKRVHQNPDQYLTNVKFVAREPVVYGSHSQLDAAQDKVRVYVDDAPFYTKPEFSVSGLSINGLPMLDLTLVPSSDNQYLEVSFSVPFRLPGHTIDVELEDTRGNLGRYDIYPQGAPFK